MVNYDKNTEIIKCLKTYQILVALHLAKTPESPLIRELKIPAPSGQSRIFTHRLRVAPLSPHVSGMVIQAMDRFPIFTHCFEVRFVVTPLQTCKSYISEEKRFDFSAKPKFKTLTGQMK